MGKISHLLLARDSWGVLFITSFILILASTAHLKFIYSEKAAQFCEIFTLLLTTVHTVQSKGNISQNFVALSEYMNFTVRVACKI